MSTPNELTQLEHSAKLALARMVELRIPMNSANYAVWYSYYAESYPDLRREIDSILETGQRFSESVNAKLYAKFFGIEQQGTAVRAAMSDLEALVGRVASFVTETQSRASDYGKMLGDVGDELFEAPNSEFGGAIDRIKEETLRMAQTFEAVETNLTEASGQLTKLGDNLDQIEQQTLRDGLTGIANWKAFHDDLRRCAIEVAETGGPVSLLMIDLDHFSQFNDRHGRSMGDKVLALVARILTEKIEPTSIAARYSGEEFAVILKQTGLTEALAQAETIRDTFSSHEFIKRHSGERFGPVTISIGVSQYKNEESLAHFIQRTRQAVQSAKAQGRNCVVARDGNKDGADKDAPKRRAS